MAQSTHTRAAAPADSMLGKVVAGRYRLEARLGEGGMGIVYRARHVLIDRVVALKLIRPDLRGETHLRAWMLREARAANRVDHAHIIDIHDIGETEDGELYLVMEYLVGTALSTEVAKGAMPVNRGVDILEQMCAALARAHDLGVVHRDLKSDNILLTVRGGRKDFVKILDFGLAALARDPRLAPKGARMVARVYPAGNAPPEILNALEQTWILAARASRLEGEVASQNRKIEALERRGRALRAEIGRKVEELAHEESRVLRDAAADHEEAQRLREQVMVAEKAVDAARQQADAAERQATGNARVYYERVGAALATMELRRDLLRERESRAAGKEASARDLRKQIEDLRGQLQRYAEALEEDLASGRERVAARVREGLAFEKAYSEVTATLMTHLKGKPECRDLFQELLNSQQQHQQLQTSRGPEGASRNPG